MPFDRRWIVVFVGSSASGVAISAGASIALARAGTGCALAGAAGPVLAASRTGAGAGPGMVSGLLAGPQVDVVATTAIAKRRFHMSRVTHAHRDDSTAHGYGIDASSQDSHATWRTPWPSTESGGSRSSTRPAGR